MRKLAALSAMAVACIAGNALARPANVSLDFNGSGNTLAATGFDGAYNLNTSGFNVGGGRLTVTGLPGDTFGNYENDPDSAQNFFFANIDNSPQITVEANVRVSGLNSNFEGGGIWLGTDTDHYIRLSLFNNSFEGGIAVEALRENEDRWGGATPPGPGDDIVGRAIPNIATSPQASDIDAVLRLVRSGSTVQAFASINGGAFQQVGGAFTFTGFGSPGDPQGNGSNTQEGGLKVGVYALGGNSPDTTDAIFAFDSLTAVGTPEPASLSLLGVAGVLAFRRQRAR
ncbi:MAG: PEP-CTERM sorting domain-containing protein [Anaerolineae bacterium]|nr:PEP-CTERM sorting domain-containing protein [Phycisphaerae bacterium]